MNRSTARFLSLILISGGLFLTASATLPILKYELSTSSTPSDTDFLSPQDTTSTGYQAGRNLTNANSWFVGQPNLPEQDSPTVGSYKLSIPKLKIKDAVVEVGGEDLSKNLIHFKNTATPGKPGNAVIFGHSTLPQLYNPKNYLTIFTQLPSLKKGDEILVNYDGISYKFKVEKMFEVKPEDIQILEQRLDNSYLTLVTCVPPGTYLRRLVVRAKIVPFQSEDTRAVVN